LINLILPEIPNCNPGKPIHLQANLKMTEPNSYNSIDALFKKAFDGLPETPAPDGWDTPSGKVWEHVQTRIETPRSGWSARTLGLIASFAVVLLIGLYLVIFPKTTPTIAPAQTESPAVVLPNTTSSPETTVVTTTPTVKPEVKIEAPVLSAKKTSKKPLQPTTQSHHTAPDTSVKNNTEPTTNHGQPRHSAGALPLPGSKLASPNTTVARKQQTWQAPLPYLPAFDAKPNVPPVPASLRFVKQ
jgi:hypothetical protein